MAEAPVATPAPAAPTTAPAAPSAAAPAPVIPEAALAALKAAGINPETWEMSLVIDGNTENVPLAVARSFAQKVRASDKRFQAAADREARFDKLAAEIKADQTKVWEAFEQLGGKADDIALARVEASLKREMERANETPRERALREENEKFKGAEREKTMKAQQEAYQGRVKAHQLAQGKVLFEAVEATSLPHTDAVAQRMVDIMRRGLDNGIEYDANTLAKLTEQEVVEEVVAVLQAQKDTGKRRKMVGEDLLQAILKGDVDVATAAPGIPAESDEPTRSENEDGSTTVRFKTGKKARKPEAQAIRDLTRALKTGGMPKPV